jgi:hypothetical protein
MRSLLRLIAAEPRLLLRESIVLSFVFACRY